MALKVGTLAPDFTLPSTSGKNISLSKDLAGKPCVLYFYPKDFTPGCTKEACEFRDQFATFRNLEVDVFGISRDNIDTHQKFKETHKLPFELLADVNGSVCKAYEALIPIIGIPKRISYLLDKEHKIVAVYQDFFGAEEHIKAMLEKLKF
ncbi:peroxiredoxin [Raineya sp.]|jgi:peroxiredoxin Q/BCP